MSGVSGHKYDLVASFSASSPTYLSVAATTSSSGTSTPHWLVA